MIRRFVGLVVVWAKISMRDGTRTGNRLGFVRTLFEPRLVFGFGASAHTCSSFLFMVFVAHGLVSSP